MPEVLNCHVTPHRESKEGVYVGRGSKWGNPFIVGKDGDRDTVIAKFRAYLLASPELIAALDELKGRDLFCWCAPRSCHADVLLELANT